MDSQPAPESAQFGPRTNNLALVSLIAGILGLSVVPLVGSIVAVITGPMAKREIQNNPGSFSGEGLATAGIVLGWIGITFGVIGFCAAGAIIGIPLCLLSLGIIQEGSSWIAPAIFALLF
jgi:predicted acyltransferase